MSTSFPENTRLVVNVAMLSLDPEDRLKVNAQHLIHFNFMEEIPAKMNRYTTIKYKITPSATQ